MVEKISEQDESKRLSKKMPTIVTDISQPLPWVARKAAPAQLTINCLQNGSVFNLSGYNFTAELWRVGGTSPVVSLTQGSGITNGGAAGTIVINYTQLQLDIAADSYRWYLKAVHPDTFRYQWLNGPFTLNGELYSGSSDQSVDLTINLGTITLDLSITLSGALSGWNDRGNFDASVGVFPSEGGSGSNGAIQKLNTYLVNVAGTIAGTFVPAGSILVAMQDSPDEEFSITGWKLF